MKRRGIERLAVILVGSLLLAPPTVAVGVEREAAEKVAQGIRQHRAGEFDAAEQSFAGAQELLPEDLRIAFDRGCALAAQGEIQEARDQLRSVTLTSDPKLAAAAHYNLGGLSVAEAKQLFGERPEEAAPESRPQGLTLLAEAVQQYRTCLRIEPSHQSARHNLELLRLWIKQMQDVWARRDREKRRDETGLLEFLVMLWNEQKEIRATARLLGREDDSPQLRRAVTLLQQQQQLLLEEMEPLREKLLAEVQGAASPGAAQPDNRQVIDLLSAMVAEIRAAVSRAQADLAVKDLPEAINSQTESLQELDKLYRAIAPFEAMLRRALESQQERLNLTKAVLEMKESAEEEDPQGDLEVDSAEASEEQAWVGGWSSLLAAKAEQGLQGLENDAAQPQDEDGSASLLPQGDDDPATPPQEAEAQRAAVRIGYEKAIELGPKISQLIDEAVDDLQQQQWQGALPSQEEALRLLKEIAESLPKQDPPQDQEQQDQNQNQQQQDQQQQDQGGEENSQDQNPDSEKKKKNEGEQPPKPDADDSSEKGKKKQQARDPNRQQAETLLRQVREREREYRDRQRELRRLIRRAVQVDKDW